MSARLGLLVGLVPLLVFASDPPHDSSEDTECTTCHGLHVDGIGLAITKTAGNANLCLGCHNQPGNAFSGWSDHQAVPGSQGRSHRWDAPLDAGTYGASAPLDPEVALHVPGGLLQCSACHEQHVGASAFPGFRQRVSVTVGAAQTSLRPGTATMTVNQPLAAAAAKGYRVQIQATTSTFRVSNDNGLTWFGWSGSAWQAGQAAGRPYVVGTPVQLTDGANVTVTFNAGTFVAGDYWRFYVSYPLLRMAMNNSELCETCHSSRVQSAAYNESGGDGVKVFSHPVGETLSKTYDRAATAVLEPNGNPQTTSDGITTNNLTLDVADRVRCLSCHSVHNADSNSLTEDLR